MSLLAVKFYKQIENPTNIPGDWPCEMFPIANEKDCPSGFITMSTNDYEAHIAKYSEEKEQWNEQFYESKEYLGEE